MKAHDEVEAANRRGHEFQAHAPRAVSARYDRRTARIVV
jgi:hypothetical protein